jgi:Domain of unknown function (DUF4190)
MKRCPTCNSLFDDEDLSYCTNDGTLLVREEDSADLKLQETAVLGEPPATVVMPPPRPTEYVPQAPNAPIPPSPYGWANESPPAWVPPPPPTAPYRGLTRPPQQGMAVASLIFGLLSITFGWICGGPIFGLLGVVLGAMALIQIKKNPLQHSGKPIAIVGLITGGIALLVYAAIIALWIVMMIIGAASN